MPETYHDVASFRFPEIVRHWARDRLVHELIVARDLARGVVREGLRCQSVDPKWLKSSESFRGEPLVGYSARPGLPPVLIRERALQHLFAVARESCDLDWTQVHEEFVTRNDFRQWLVHTGRPMPAFWYASDERFDDRAASRREP